jgi:hypothetical protein
LYHGIRAGVGAYSAWSRSRTNTTSNNPGGMVSNYGNGGATVSRQYRRTGRKRRHTAKSVQRDIVRSGSNFVYRWQQTTPTYLGPGRLALGWTNETPFIQRVPIHFMSLSHFPLGTVYNPKGCFNHGLSRISYDQATSNYRWTKIPSQMFDGGTDATGVWQAERNDGGITTLKGSVLHKWTDLKINLYGSYAIPIRYQVFLCTMDEQVDAYQYSENVPFVLGTETNNMYKDISKNLLYSSIGSNGHVHWPKNVRIIKKCNVLVQPLTYSDQKAEQDMIDFGNGVAPHIHELRWFINHDRYRDYRWSENETQVNETFNLNTPGWDVSRPTTNMCDVEWGKRLFLYITATSPLPETQTVVSDYQSIAETRFQGSYDICVRNGFQVWGVQ